MAITPLGRLCHWGPLFALATIKIISFSMWHCSLMWWPPGLSIGGLLNFAIFTMWSMLSLYNFFNAMFVGPGYLPLKWKPDVEENAQYLQYCHFCEGYKAPRAHHCRKCNRCSMKMDHHCPWINNCCGHRNHTHFTIFLFCAVCGSIQASFVIACSLYRALNRTWYIYYGTGDEPIVNLGLWGFICGLFALGMALGVVIAVGTLWYVQMKSIIKNQTGIEGWIVAKAELMLQLYSPYRISNENFNPSTVHSNTAPSPVFKKKDCLDKAYRHRADGNTFIYPYNLGWKHNLRQVFTPQLIPLGDGITWPVVEGCDQYTLTREQIQQKEEKRLRTREYSVVEPSSGSWLPVSKGVKVCCNPPFSDEPRIKLEEGNRVLVTRWKRHWLYGEKIDDESQYSRKEVVRVRGWFPRRCAVEVINGDHDAPQSTAQSFTKKKKKKHQ